MSSKNPADYGRFPYRGLGITLFSRLVRTASNFGENSLCISFFLFDFASKATYSAHQSVSARRWQDRCGAAGQHAGGLREAVGVGCDHERTPLPCVVNRGYSLGGEKQALFGGQFRSVGRLGRRSGRAVSDLRKTGHTVSGSQTGRASSKCSWLRSYVDAVQTRTLPSAP